MGYYTGYTLKVDPGPAGPIIDDLRRTCEDAEYALDANGNQSELSKWYENEQDLREFSKLYPEHLFTLSGEGEEAGDVWKKYFKDGKCQVAKAVIAIAEFNPKKLA